LKLLRIAALLGSVALVAPAFAQAPPVPPGGVVYAPSPAALAVTATTGRVALPQTTVGLLTTFPFVVLINNGNTDLFFKLGDNTVVATTSDYPLPAGACTAVWAAATGTTSVAAITAAGATTLRVVGANGAPLFSCPGGSLKVSPAAGTASTIATGGTAVTLVTGPVNGGYVTNPSNTAAQGVTAENAYVDPVGTPLATDAGANGTTTLLAPGQTFDIPPLASGKTLKGNAATTGHKLTVVVW
jgi:hypothetical protein